MKALKKLKGRNKNISPSASHRRPTSNVGEEMEAGQEGGKAEATEEDEDELPATPTTPSSPFSMFGPRVGAAGALRGRSSSSAKGPELPPRLPRGASTATVAEAAAACTALSGRRRCNAPAGANKRAHCWRCALSGRSQAARSSLGSSQPNGRALVGIKVK